MQGQDQRGGQLFRQPFAHPFNLSDARQEGQQVANLLAPGRQDRTCHGVFKAQFGPCAQPADRQRMRPARAFNHGCAGAIFSQKAGKARAIQRRGHDDKAQIGPQNRPGFKRQGKAEIGIEMPFMRLVEQHGRDTREFLILEDLRDENRLGHDQNAGLGAAPAVHPGEIADGFARSFAQHFGHALGRRPRRHPAWRKDDDTAAAP